MADYVDETHERISAFAEEFVEEDERESFVDAVLERRGYQRVAHWAPPEGTDQGAPKKPLLRPVKDAKGKGGTGGPYFGRKAAQG